jgi:hypothetical protein
MGLMKSHPISSVTFAALVGILPFVSTATFAQSPTPKQKSASVTATLYRVESGLFDAEMGKVMDLTDRMILFKWEPWNTNEQNLKQKYLLVTFNNRAEDMKPGKRIDLKEKFREELKDKTRCFIDLIDVVVPQGGAAIATFRFECR